ncbi:hypothetical protein WR25_16536 [Diploscapter pachys]|uniref:BAR domain-containing protein n=1 Tax=Diploscapter pachys TaxID=2018661 RepID=A0A2A2JU16_9BILA|nr:hypothetical protein WR25_16536 [Diploscapter pachys]
MMRTALIHDLFKDMDTSSSALFIEVNKTGISFITIGDMGKVTTTIPSKSVLMDAIDCPVPIRHRYRMGMMRRMTQALSIAEKVSLRFDSEGVLGAQFIIRHESCGEGNEIFTEFFLKRLLRDVNYGGGNRASSMSTSKSQSSDDNALNANANFYGVDPCDLSGDSIVSKLKTWLKDKQVLPNDLQGEYSRLDAYKLAIDKVLQSMTVIMEENPEQRKNLNDANMHCVPSTPDNDNYARVSTFLSNYLSTCEKNKDQAKRVGKLENTSEVQRICRELARIKVDYLTKMRKAVREIRNFVRTEYWSMVEVKKDVMISMHELEYARSGKSKNSDDDENRLRMAEQVVEKKLEDSRRNVATLDGLQDKHMDAILKWMAIKVGYHRKMCEAIDVKRT